MKVTNETQALAYEILAYWKRFNHHDQSSWVQSNTPEILTEKVGKKEVNYCNTTMCAAGTAVFLNTTPKKFKEIAWKKEGDDEWWERNAGELLGLSQREAELVFYSDNESAVRYMKAIAAGSQKKFDKATDKRNPL
jgi:hypothetical protein